MKTDLQNLQVSEKELKELTGNSNNLSKFKITIWGTVWRTLLLWGAAIAIASFINNDLSLVLLSICIIFGPFIAMIVPVIRTRGRAPESLKKLVEESQKFNLVVKAIDVNDQLIAAGNGGMSLEERKKAIDALSLTREDLIRAFKTEKILRENKEVINLNPEFFTTNLARLSTLEADSKAGEFGKILGDALSVSREVQEEMKKMQETSI